MKDKMKWGPQLWGLGASLSLSLSCIPSPSWSK
jgi:hypothetical protein